MENEAAQGANVVKAELSEGAEARIIAMIEQKLAALEQRKPEPVVCENESRIAALEQKVAELEQRKPAEPAKGADEGEGKLAELEAKVAKLDEFLAPHGHNRVIPEVVEPQCQSEIPEPQTE